MEDLSAEGGTVGVGVGGVGVLGGVEEAEEGVELHLGCYVVVAVVEVGGGGGEDGEGGDCVGVASEASVIVVS